MQFLMRLLYASSYARAFTLTYALSYALTYTRAYALTYTLSFTGLAGTKNFLPAGDIHVHDPSSKLSIFQPL